MKTFEIWLESRDCFSFCIHLAFKKKKKKREISFLENMQQLFEAIIISPIRYPSYGDIAD